MLYFESLTLGFGPAFSAIPNNFCNLIIRASIVFAFKASGLKCSSKKLLRIGDKFKVSLILSLVKLIFLSKLIIFSSTCPACAGSPPLAFIIKARTVGGKKLKSPPVSASSFFRAFKNAGTVIISSPSTNSYSLDSCFLASCKAFFVKVLIIFPAFMLVLESVGTILLIVSSAFFLATSSLSIIIPFIWASLILAALFIKVLSPEFIISAINRLMAT